MALGLMLYSLLYKEGAARSILTALDEVKDASVVIRDTGRKGLELRGTYHGRPVMIRICLVWTGCSLTMRSKVLESGGFLVRRDYEMDRDAYQAWEKNKNPEWDGKAVEVRRYLGKHAYVELGDDENRREYDDFAALPTHLQTAVIAAVDQDAYGRVHLLREELKLSVSKRIFRVWDPVAFIRRRLDLAAQILDACEARAS